MGYKDRGGVRPCFGLSNNNKEYRAVYKVCSLRSAWCLILTVGYSHPTRTGPGECRCSENSYDRCSLNFIARFSPPVAHFQFVEIIRTRLSRQATQFLLTIMIWCYTLESMCTFLTLTDITWRDILK